MGHEVASAVALALVLSACSRSALSVDDLSDAPAGGGSLGGPVAADGGAGRAPANCDHDGDGHLRPDCGGDDCDDTDARRYPGADDSNLVLGAWSATTVLERHSGDSRGEPTIAIDAHGVQHVAYAGASGAAMYANDASGAWVATELDPGGRGRASVVVDAADTVHVVYGTLTDLKHAFRTVGGPWEVEVIGRGTKPAALSDAGGLHVAYDTEPGIAYARLAAGSWQTETVADHGSDPALAIAPDGTVHVAWGNQNDAAAPGVMHARRVASGFAVEPVVSGYVTAVSLGVRRDGTLAIAFGSAGFGTQGANLASFEAGRWQSTLVIPTVGYVWSTATLLDRAGRLHIVSGGEQVEHAVESVEGFVVEHVRPEGYASGAVLERGVALHIVYTYFRYPDVTLVDHLTNGMLAPDGVDEDCNGHDG